MGLMYIWENVYAMGVNLIKGKTCVMSENEYI